MTNRRGRVQDIHCLVFFRCGQGQPPLRIRVPAATLAAQTCVSGLCLIKPESLLVTATSLLQRPEVDGSLLRPAAQTCKVPKLWGSICQALRYTGLSGAHVCKNLSLKQPDLRERGGPHGRGAAAACMPGLTDRDRPLSD